ncbi:hypothetical protein [Nocardia pseudovaccinii]|uniref:hypothetical protein n=1 Tax=Nocardia pseudovaccinii TaxID=189540 RepID=UPI0007A42576|nr:hypothetical protein [Nocardia pseudovaccinii]
MRDGLLSAVIDADELVSRGRWVNTAKLVADEFPDLVATRLAEVSSQGGDDHNRPNRRSVGARATLSSRIARRLAKPVRQQLIATLAEWEPIDHTPVFPRPRPSAGSRRG